MLLLALMITILVLESLTNPILVIHCLMMETLLLPMFLTLCCNVKFRLLLCYHEFNCFMTHFLILDLLPDLFNFLQYFLFLVFSSWIKKLILYLVSKSNQILFIIFLNFEIFHHSFNLIIFHPNEVFIQKFNYNKN